MIDREILGFLILIATLAVTYFGTMYVINHK